MLVDALDGVDQLRVRVFVRVAVVKPVDVRQQDKKIGADAHRDDRREGVVVADDDLLRRDGVVFVEDGQSAQL